MRPPAYALLALVAALTLMVACGGEESPSPTPQAVAGITPAASSPTPTATVAPTPTPTPTPPTPSPTPTAPAACTAPAAPSGPAGWTQKGQGCVILQVPPGGEVAVDAMQLSGANIGCAGAGSTNGWQVWLPPGASVNIRTAVSTGGGPTTIASGNSGTAGGYCGTIFVQNPGSATVTVHVNWRMWCAAPC
ncbi:MAG: hypothetical protein NZ695_04575 [Dehalococcoidia bacterium]|jgi:hypothetical protein|nr:hypothetical protein [Dehalococcoidia bacterium]MDW8008552.1 hypothetical protein [Chloroflexota bacterium]